VFLLIGFLCQGYLTIQCEGRQDNSCTRSLLFRVPLLVYQLIEVVKRLPYRSCHSSCKKAKSSPIYPGSHHGKEPWIDTLCCLKVQGNCHCLSLNRDKDLIDSQIYSALIGESPWPLPGKEAVAIRLFWTITGPTFIMVMAEK
jgi:hypothetical protein